MKRGGRGLFGGSFDPVHVGHLHAAHAAQAAHGLERIVFAPAGRPPHKPGRRLAAPEHRVAMLRLALAGEPTWTLWTGELDRAGPSYTLDTVEQLAAEGAGITHLILGDDNLEGLPAWRGVEELLLRLQPVVVPRLATERELLERIAADFSPEVGERLRAGWVEAPPQPVSATELRDLLEQGLDPGELVPRAVREYLLAQDIYGSRAAGERG